MSYGEMLDAGRDICAAVSIPVLGDGIRAPLLHRNVQRFRGGHVFKAHRRCVSLNSRLESNKEEEKKYENPKPPTLNSHPP